MAEVVVRRTDGSGGANGRCRDLLADAGTSTEALPVVTHLVAAAIVIPAVAHRPS